MIVSRLDWNARDQQGEGNKLGKPKGVAIHWEGPKIGSREHSACPDLVRSIQDFHQRVRGWSDVAYNFMVCEHGYVFEGRGAYRGSAANGSTQANLDYHAICALVGQGDPIPDLLLQGIKEARQVCIDAGVGNEVVGHRDLFNTSCPGPDLYEHVQKGTFAGPIAKTVAAVKKAVVKVVTAKPTPTLRRGSTGAHVKALQAGLNRAFPAYSHLAVDGQYGPATEVVVKEFQRRCGLSRDGVVGPNTRAVLNKYGIKF